ncbi:MAG TPA: hypothetical protein VGI88_02110 [Verrucomicrobiae bacterium]|jgi:hypothetical protein
MAYKPELENGENLRYCVALALSQKAQPFHFAVSDRAVYWPAIKLIAKTDPYYFRRITHDQVQEVEIRKLPPYGFWVLAALMILAGLITSVLMMGPLLSREPGVHRISGWPFAVLVGGFILPFAARGRFGLKVTTSKESFRWKPPMVVDKTSKDKVAETLNDISRACQAAGLRVKDEREKAAVD